MDFNKAINFSKNDPNIYHNRGEVYSSVEDYVNAHKDFDRAI